MDGVQHPRGSIGHPLRPRWMDTTTAAQMINRKQAGPHAYVCMYVCGYGHREKKLMEPGYHPYYPAPQSYWGGDESSHEATYVCMYVCMYAYVCIYVYCMCEDLWVCKYLHVSDEPHDTVGTKGNYIHTYIHTYHNPFPAVYFASCWIFVEISTTSIASGSFFFPRIILSSSRTMVN